MNKLKNLKKHEEILKLKINDFFVKLGVDNNRKE